jgi:hypothetical protein
MMRGVLTLMLGFVVGSGLMLSFWPHPPVGIAAPRSSDLRIFISDRYLARTIQDRFAGGAIPAVGDVQVESAPPTSLVIRLHVSLGPLSLPAALELAPVAEHGSINVSVVSTDLAGVSIPGQLTVFVSSVINRQVNAVLHQAGRVTGVKILPAGIEVFANNP